MRKIISYTLTLLIASTLCSCEGFLDRRPVGSYDELGSMETPDDCQQVIFGIYSSFKNSALYSGTMVHMQDLQSDLAYSVQGNYNTYGDAYKWQLIATNRDAESVYAGLYQIIARCNFFFDLIGDVEAAYTDTDDVELIEKCKGDAHFARALAYSELLKIFCEPYLDDAHARSTLGMPMVMSYFAHKNGNIPKRSTLYESYNDYVLKDLESAKLLIQREGYDSPYFSVGAVDALYARIYLYMGKWDKAIEYSTNVIEGKTYTLARTTVAGGSYNGNTISEYDNMWIFDSSREIIWKVAMDATDRGGSLGNVYMGFNGATYIPDYVPGQWLLDLYADDDRRYSSFFTQVTTGYDHRLQWPMVTKFRGNPEIDGSGAPVFTNMPKVFRLSEQYLIRAEAYYESGQEAKANTDLSTLRRARYSSYGSSAYSGTTLRDEIRDERARELCFEGFRLADLKRWQTGFKRTPQQYTISPYDALRIEAGNPLFTWPIPQHEIDAVPDMEGNASNK